MAKGTHNEELKDQELSFDRFAQDMDWIEDQYENLKEKFPEEYVAVFDREVIGHNSDFEKLLEELRSKYGDRVSELAIKYIYKEQPAIVL
jgi:hypothetical protein